MNVFQCLSFFAYLGKVSNKSSPDCMRDIDRR